MFCLCKQKLLLGNNKGSFTVEASIVFSLTFLLVIALVYVFIIMYQYTYIQSVANQASNVGGYYYSDKYGTNSKINSNLYWRTLDGKSKHKKEQLNTYINKKLDKSIIDSTIIFDNSIANNFLLKQVKVEIESQYRLPIGSMLEIFGLSPILKIKAQSNSNIYDNAEFVRNLDTITDIKKCISQSDNKWIGKDSKVNDVVDKLLKKH